MYVNSRKECRNATHGRPLLHVYFSIQNLRRRNWRILRSLTLFALIGSLPQLARAQSISASATLASSGSAFYGSVGGLVPQESDVTGDGIGGTIHIMDFNGPTDVDPNGVARYSGNYEFNPGTRPTGDTSDCISVSGNQTMTINFIRQIVYFGLYWGSPDVGTVVSGELQGDNIITFNQVTGSTVTQLAQFDPKSIPGFNSDYSFSSDDAYVSFNASGESFNQVVFSDPGNPAFETDNHSYVIAPAPVALTIAEKQCRTADTNEQSGLGI